MNTLTPSAGVEQRELGLYAVELNNADLMTLARDVAKLIACQRGSVTIDEVRAHESLKDRQPSSPNFWGAVFIEKGWRVVAETRSTQKQNHRRRIYRWEWQP